jgi:hypothetical protein
MERIAYKGWKDCCRLANDRVELVVTTEVGPRIIRFGFIGRDNEFREFEATLGKTGGGEWRIYGGHRLWHAPEAEPRTYAPDNDPVEVEKHKHFTRFIQPVEASTGIQKELDVDLSETDAHVEIIHRLRNTNLWTVELAPWALSVMAPGGRAILPLPPRGPHPKHLLPTNTLTLWAYTDMSDPRWKWGERYILLRQDPRAAVPQKIGAMITDGWAAYARAGHLFLKKFNVATSAVYPDHGCSVEIFTNADMLELETLGPLIRLQPGGVVEHVEHWFLFDNVATPATDAEVDAQVLPRVHTANIH